METIPKVQGYSLRYHDGYKLTCIWPGDLTGANAKLGTLLPKLVTMTTDDLGNPIGVWEWTPTKLAQAALAASNLPIRLTVTTNTGDNITLIGDGIIKRAKDGTGDLQQNFTQIRYVGGIGGGTIQGARAMTTAQVKALTLVQLEEFVSKQATLLVDLAVAVKQIGKMYIGIINNSSS